MFPWRRTMKMVWKSLQQASNFTSIHPFLRILYTVKKEKKIFLIYKEIQLEQLQSHIWLTASSYIGKYLRISSYIRKPFLKYDFATAPLWISWWGKFYFLFYQCMYARLRSLVPALTGNRWIQIQQLKFLCLKVCRCTVQCTLFTVQPWARICKRLRIPGIDFEESIPPAWTFISVCTPVEYPWS